MPQPTRPPWQHAFFAACPDTMIHQGADGTVLECKPGRGHEPIVPLAVMVGKRPSEFLPEPAAQRTEEVLHRALTTGQVVTTEISVGDHGRRRHFELRCVPYAADQAVTIVREVTRRTNAEELIVARDRVLERLFHASVRINAERTLDSVLQEIADSAREVIRCRYAALGVLSTKRDVLDRFVLSGVSAKTAERIGRPPSGQGVLGLLMTDPKPIRLADIASHPAAHGFPPHHPIMHSFLGVPVMTSDGPVGNLYFTEKIDGPEFTDEDEAVAVMFAANAAVAVRNARLDEEAVRLLHDLQAMQHNRDRFYAMVNHELRNALTAVYGWSELMLRKAGESPPRAMTETLDAAQHALELLNDLLDLSRLDAEMLEIRREEVTAGDIATEAINAVRPVAVGGRVVLAVRGATTAVFTTDSRRVRQILVNLLSNAVRHSPADSTVTVEIVAFPESIEFRVIDRGEGIGQKELAIIFDAYARAQTSTGGGTGLGLTLSRRLARLLGGDLTVKSELNKGSTFVLTLPTG